MENKLKYWIAVAAKDHIAHGLRDEFMQANHGKPAPNIKFYNAIDSLDFIKNKKSRGFPFRLGFFEIGEGDFKIISIEMLKK